MPESTDVAVASVVAAGVDAIGLAAQGQRAGADRGDPQVSSHVIHRDDRSGTTTGVWMCTVGSWPVPSRVNTEVAHILSGRARITDADGREEEVAAGDVLVLPVGWSGRWEILEPVRKMYVIVDAVPDAPALQDLADA